METVFSSSSEEAGVTDGDRSSEFTYRDCQEECISKVTSLNVHSDSLEGGATATAHLPRGLSYTFSIKFNFLRL